MSASIVTGGVMAASTGLTQASTAENAASSSITVDFSAYRFGTVMVLVVSLPAASRYRISPVWVIGRYSIMNRPSTCGDGVTIVMAVNHFRSATFAAIGGRVTTSAATSGRSLLIS